MEGGREKKGESMEELDMVGRKGRMVGVYYSTYYLDFFFEAENVNRKRKRLYMMQAQSTQIKKNAESRFLGTPRTQCLLRLEGEDRPGLRLPRHIRNFSRSGPFISYILGARGPGRNRGGFCAL